MKLFLKNPESFVNEKMMIIKKEVPCLDTAWHYHKQLELIYISKSNGIRFVGDSVSQFTAGDLVLVGSYLPHLWRNDPSYYTENEEGSVRTIIIKFLPDFISAGTFENPIFSSIKNLFEEANFGVSFGENTSKNLHKDLINLVDQPLPVQAIKLMDILYRLSVTSDKVILSSTDMRQYSEEKSHKIDEVLRFISDNYAGDINLKDVSDIACMTTNSFCRYFKRLTNKSFVDFLNEIRIRNAARLLAQEDNLNISEVCYTVGYKSITNFNHQFKNIMGTNPKNYRDSIRGVQTNSSELAETTG